MMDSGGASRCGHIKGEVKNVKCLAVEGATIARWNNSRIGGSG